MKKKIGRQSFILPLKPRIVSSAAFVGNKEGDGPLGKMFDVVCKDDTVGLDSWEQAESRMLQSAVKLALRKIDRSPEDIDIFLGGDLLSQIISAGFAARELRSPFMGMYGACSTMAESIITAAMLTDGGFSDLSICGASSHFSSSEREFRYPLEMGTQSSPTSQRTVTGAAAVAICSSDYKIEDPFYSDIAVVGGTIGSVQDYGITDASNMGAAMAPAAASTICTHFADYGICPDHYDRIFTGDLGSFGTQMLYELCDAKGYDLSNNHSDCGMIIFSPDQNVMCGGSGCGCCASVLSARILPDLNSGKLSRILFVATGALLSPLSALQGETIPSIAHAAVLERKSL